MTNISDLSSGNSFFPLSMPNSLKDLSRMALVNSLWNKMQQLEGFWQPLLTRFSEECKFYIVLPPEASAKSKVQIYINELLNLKNTLVQSLGLLNESYFVNLSFSSKFHVNTIFKIDITKLVVKLITKFQFPIIEKLIHYKATFNTCQIALILFTNDYYTSLGTSKRLCLDLMIKRKYDLASFFNKILENDKNVMTTLFTALTNTKHLKILDYIECGCDFSLIEKRRPNFSLLDIAMPVFLAFYQTGKFQSFTLMDEDLSTEDDLKNMIFDLMTKAGLTLSISGLGGTVLDRLRYLGLVLPKGNAVAQALDAYDLLEIHPPIVIK